MFFLSLLHIYICVYQAILYLGEGNKRGKGENGMREILFKDQMVRKEEKRERGELAESLEKGRRENEKNNNKKI